MVIPRFGSRPSTTFSATVSGGTSMKCWCTIPTPASIASAVFHPVTSVSSSSPLPTSLISTLPPSLPYIPLRIRISVDFPAPFSPTRAWISPRVTSSEAPRLATTSPKVLTIPLIRTASGAFAALGVTGAVIGCPARGSSRR